MKFFVILLISSSIFTKLSGFPRQQDKEYEKLAVEPEGAIEREGEGDTFTIELTYKCLAEELRTQMLACDFEAISKLNLTLPDKKSSPVGNEKSNQSIVFDLETDRLIFVMISECYLKLEAGLMDENTRKLNKDVYYKIYMEKASLSPEQKSSFSDSIKSCLQEENIDISLPIILYPATSTKTGLAKGSKTNGEHFISPVYLSSCAHTALISNGCSDSSLPIAKMLQDSKDYEKEVLQYLSSA